jgi:Class III cytochrome C family
VRPARRRLTIAMLLGGALLIAPPAVSGGAVWDIGIAFGYVCTVLLLCLYLFPVRGDGLPHARLFGLSQHRAVGWWLLGAALAHVAVLLVAQPSIGRYLLPSAPVFMWCGVFAAILAAVLVYTGLVGRSALRGSGSMIAANVHIVLTAMMVFVLCAHITGSAQLVTGTVKTTAVFVLFVLPLAWFALRPRGPPRKYSTLRRATHMVAAACIALVPSSMARHVLLEPTLPPEAIAVNLPHEHHTSVNCVVCHHNYVDHSGISACIECHRSRRADLTRSSESTFHTFCRECHTQLALQAQRHGPTRACSGCH